MKKHVVNTVTGETAEIEMTLEEAVEFEASRVVIPTLPEETATRPDDIERALIAKGLLTSADVTAAKRNRP